jgi:hypothetical protein
MLLIGIVLCLAGFFLVAFNRRVVIKIVGKPIGPDTLSTSVSRQNIAIIGAACIFGGLLMIYLAMK